MGDRIPIGTHPGLVSDLVGADLPIAELTADETAVAIFLRRTDQEAADVVTASLRNATGGGGSGIACNFAAGATTATATGSLTGSNFYLRVATADANSRNLTGYVELVHAAGATAALASLAELKQYLNIDVATDDDLLTRILLAASSRIQTRAGRAIVEAVITGELHDASGGDDRLVLWRRPVTAVSEVRIDGTAIAAGSYQLAAAAGILYRRDADDPNAYADVWPLGRRHIAVDYTAGYSTIPPELKDAAIKQAAFDWRLSAPGGYRIGDRGTTLDVTGSASYLTPRGGWCPGVEQMVDAWRAVQVAP